MRVVIRLEARDLHFCSKGPTPGICADKTAQESPSGGNLAVRQHMQKSPAGKRGFYPLVKPCRSRNCFAMADSCQFGPCSEASDHKAS